MHAHQTLGAQIAFELIDSATGQPQQVWHFSPSQRVTIGRAAESDLVLTNPYVSRCHAYVEPAGDGWRVVSVSSQQLVVDGRKTAELLLTTGVVFRLGPTGSLLRFQAPQSSTEARGATSTLCSDPELQPLLILDRKRLAQDVSQITTGAFFQRLSQTLEQLRRTRD
jgi:pSer/pThr/pTyr-binding forkhead associated (FHA) protein